MAALEDLLQLIPEGDEFKLLRDTLSRIAADFPDALDQIDGARVNKWVEELGSGEGRSGAELRSDIFKYVVTTEEIQRVYGVDEATADQVITGEITAAELSKEAEESPVPTPAEAEEGLPGVLKGGQTVKVETADGITRYYQVYEYPPGSGQFLTFQYDSVEQLEATHGGMPQMETWSEEKYDQRSVGEGTAAEIAGEGTFEGYIKEIVRDEAMAAGIDDPTLLGQIVNDPEMQTILAQAAVGDWTPEQVLAAQRNTRFWKEVLYPGIERFYGQTTDPERAWAQYVQNVEGALTELGYERDADGTFNSHIKEMLDRGIDDTTFLNLASTFVRATHNTEFADVLSQWSERELGRGIEFGEWFDLLEGDSTLPELQGVVEKATLAYAAQQQGTKISEREIRDIAERTELSEAQARRAFSEVNQAVLALGEKGLARGNLTRDDILSAAAGAAPVSGRSIEEVRILTAKLAQENDLFDEEKLSFYVGFDPLGRPTRPGLQGLTPEGA